jgi:hypothetical protein
MTSTIVKPTTLDTELLQIGEIQTNAMGGKSFKIGYNGEQKFHIRTPVMTVQFETKREEGKEYKPGQKGQDKLFVNMSFKPVEYNADDIYQEAARSLMKSEDIELQEAIEMAKEQITQKDLADKLEEKNSKSVADVEAFEQMMNTLDDWLISKGVENSVSWLKMKKANEDIVGALFNRTIKCSKDKDTGEPDGRYPNTFRIRIPMKDEKILYPVFDEFGENVTSVDTVMDFKRGARVSFILECSGVYFASGKFGFTAWQQFQARLWKKAPEYKGYGGIPKNVCLIDDDTDDEEEEQTVTTTAPVVEKVETVAPKKTTRVVRKKAN